MRSAPKSYRSKAALYLLVAATVAAAGCSTSNTGGALGCASMNPIPSGRYVGPKTDNAINVRLSTDGVNYINANWRMLIDMFAPGETLTVPVACIKQSFPVVGNVLIADQNLNQKCDNGEQANVGITVTGFQLVPIPNDKVQGTVSVTLDTGNINIDSESTSWLGCLGLSAIECSINFNTARNSPSNQVMKATIQFTIDTKFDNLLAFKITGLTGTDVCGSSGAPAAPECLDALDLQLNGENTCGDVYCGTADWDPIKTFVLQLISPLLQGQVQTLLAQQSCEACGGTGMPACIAGSSCDGSSKTCIDTADSSHCAPRFLGVEGRMDLSSMLGAFGTPPGSNVDLSVAAGSSVSVDTGINLGMRAGLTAVTVSNCVPPQTAPAMPQINAPDFDHEFDPTAQNNTYHVALGISDPFINLALYNVEQSGGLCLQMSSSTVGVLNTGLFKTFLPSLGNLATVDGKDAPMMIVLRPAAAPTVDIGKGTYDPVTKKPIDPLITMSLPNVTVDFYAMLSDRYARLFSLTADIKLPLSLIFEGCDSVTPAIGDLKMLITNIRTANSEILAEDPKVLADLIPAVIGLAEPAVTSALKPFQLPPVGSFKLKVNEVKGLGAISGTSNYNHLGIYATLLPLNGQCATGTPTTTLSLKQSIIPKASEMVATGKGLPWPKAVLDVHALGMNGTPEFAFRVDHGTWSTFLAAPGDELVVEHPAFLFQGMHTIEVRSRVAEVPHGVSTPVSVGFLVDWDPPAVTLTADREHDALHVAARDTVTPDAKLLYAYKVGDGLLSDFGPAREIVLSAIEAQGGVTVQVKDETGNLGAAEYRVAGTVNHPDTALGTAPTAATPGTGCSTSPGAFSLLLALGVLLGFRRKR